ncbi:MAG: helix-turn-helix transcriptional regulator [Desulfobacteraceae bacterium]|nr:MAG: helix-turn-helix transcriptional regulator [Desulfobacteraceae bacterium]
MTKKDGQKTKKKILKVAEKLFSEKGFDGASVDKIAKTAGVNKALIYYHFKNKNDIIVSLFKNIVEEVEEYVDRSFDAVDNDNMDANIQKEIQEEIKFLAKRKKIISVMLMESFKSKAKDNFLFQCAEIVVNHDAKRLMEEIGERKREKFPEKQRFLVHEFFTGFIPVVAFVALRDKWAEYFKCDSDKVLEYFIDSFTSSHLASHMVAIDK